MTGWAASAVRPELLDQVERFLTADYDPNGHLLGIEILAPCEIAVLDKIARRESKPIKNFLRNSIPRGNGAGRLDAYLSDSPLPAPAEKASTSIAKRLPTPFFWPWKNATAIEHRGSSLLCRAANVVKSVCAHGFLPLKF